MPRLTFPRFAVPVLLALAVGAAGCGGADDAEQADATVPKQTRTATTPATPATTPTVTVPTTTTPAPPQTTATQPPQTTPTTPAQNGGATTPATPSRPAPSKPQTGGAGTPSNTSSACGTVANGFISGMQASGAACSEAASVANEWLGAVGESGPEGDVVAGGYACSGRKAGDSTAVTCIGDGGRRVTFSANN